MDKEVLENVKSAISNGRTDIVHALLLTLNEKGDVCSEADNNNLELDVLLNAISNEHGSLLHLATKLEQPDIVRTLLSAGANPNVQNSENVTPYQLVLTDQMRAVYIGELLISSAKSDITRLSQLIDSGVPVDSKDLPLSGNTALHWAATYGNASAVQCLLEYGASVNITNADGATPLHDAVVRNNIEIAKLLLNAGADPLLPSSDRKYKNKTPADLASDNPALLKLINSFVSPSHATKKLSNGNISITSSSLESLHQENGLMKSISSLSLDSPIKQSMSSYVLQSSTLPPFPLLSSPPLLITDTRLHLLWPLPHQIVQNDGPLFKLKDKYSVCIVQDFHETSGKEVVDLWHSHKENFSLLGIECAVEDITSPSAIPSGGIICYVNKDVFDKMQCYKIIITSSQLRIYACDVWGLHYGVCTVLQLFRLYQGEDGIPPLYIEDWPALQYRGILLDMVPASRKPTMDTLKGLIRTFSSLKLNQIHFYFRFQSNCENQKPYTNCDLLHIVEFCHQHHIVPIPSIDVSPEASADSLDGCGAEIRHMMSLFSSKSVHIGPNMSRIILDSISENSNLSMWASLLLPSDSLVYLCSNGFAMNRKLLQMLPLNIILVEYGYQADYDYDSCIKNVIFSGLPVCVGVGTASWGSIAGCPETATNNIYKASVSSVHHGGLGMIVSDWKTMPHHSALCFSWPAIVLASGLSWNSSVHLDFLHTRLPELLNHYVFMDSEQILGYLTVELGRLEAYIHQTTQVNKTCIVQQEAQSSSVLHQFLVNPNKVQMDNFTTELLQQAVCHVRRFMYELKKAKPNCFQHDNIVSELQMAIDLQLFACKLGNVMVRNGLNPFPAAGYRDITNFGVTNLPPTIKTDLANRLLTVIKDFRSVWLSRSLPCGLNESLYLFNMLLNKLIPDSEHFFSSADGFVRQ